MEFIPEHWSDDYLVFEDEKAKQSLAIVREAASGDDAVEIFNRDLRVKRGKKKQPRATHFVRITTFEGTIAQLKAAGWTPPKPRKKERSAR